MRIETKVFKFDEYEADLLRREALPLTDPEHPRGYTIDAEARTLDIYWGGYEYWIELHRINHPVQLLELIHHLSAKGWDGMTAQRVGRLIVDVFKFRDWDLYGKGAPPRRDTDADEERRKLTPDLRYKILKRDGFRCRACGAGPEHGAVLHIDHIVPISKGGRTEYANLQALCAMCNLGKRDKGAR